MNCRGAKKGLQGRLTRGGKQPICSPSGDLEEALRRTVSIPKVAEEEFLELAGTCPENNFKVDACFHPRTEGKARGSEQPAAFTFWVRGPGDPSHSIQSFCLLPEEAATEVLWKTDSLSRGQ